MRQDTDGCFRCGGDIDAVRMDERDAQHCENCGIVRVNTSDD